MSEKMRNVLLAIGIISGLSACGGSKEKDQSGSVDGFDGYTMVCADTKDNVCAESWVDSNQDSLVKTTRASCINNCSDGGSCSPTVLCVPAIGCCSYSSAPVKTRLCYYAAEKLATGKYLCSINNGTWSGN